MFNRVFILGHFTPLLPQAGIAELTTQGWVGMAIAESVLARHADETPFHPHQSSEHRFGRVRVRVAECVELESATALADARSGCGVATPGRAGFATARWSTRRQRRTAVCASVWAGETQCCRRRMPLGPRPACDSIGRSSRGSPAARTAGDVRNTPTFSLSPSRAAMASGAASSASAGHGPASSHGRQPRRCGVICSSIGHCIANARCGGVGLARWVGCAAGGWVSDQHERGGELST